MTFVFRSTVDALVCGWIDSSTNHVFGYVRDTQLKKSGACGSQSLSMHCPHVMGLDNADASPFSSVSIVDVMISYAGQRLFDRVVKGGIISVGSW